MKVVYWGQGLKEFAKHFLSKVHQAASPALLDAHENLTELLDLVKKPQAGNCLWVLAPTTLDELKCLQALRPLIEGEPVILLLPSDEPETFHLAHKFHPRFLASFRGNVSNAAAVAANMLNRKSAA